jgi:hypothetical protein
MSEPEIQPKARPCRFCVANWAAVTGRFDRPPIVPDAAECEMTHRDDPRVYDLALAMAKVFQHRKPTDAQISYFLEDADQVVDRFDPAPEQWKVRRLPPSDNDGPDGIDVRMRINDVTFVGLEGGKDCRGSVVPLKEFRSW